jgi:hypothetical protein
MQYDKEPTNLASFYGCGLCPAWFQVLSPDIDPQTGQQRYDPEFDRYYVINDEEAACAELWAHAAEVHGT